jgi:hypothetical protein
MAKKKSQLTNPLADLAEGARPSSRKKQEMLDNPLEHVSRGEARKAANPQGKDTTRVGQYIRRTFTIPPEMDDALNELADDLGVGKMKLVRYLLSVGLDQILHSDSVPTKKVVTVDLEMVEWQHPS